MNLLHIYKTYYPDSIGGVEQVIRQLNAGTAKKNIKNYLATVSPFIKKPEILHIEGLEVHRFPLSFEKASCPFSFQLFKHFSDLIQQADILHYHFPWPFADILHLGHAVKKPSLVTYHSDIVKQKFLKKFYQPIMQCFLNKVDKIIVTSDNNLHSSIDLQNYKNKCEVIPLGINSDEYPAPSTELLEKWRKRLPLPFIFFIGVLRYYKGLHFLIEAAANTNLPIIIAGDGPERAYLENLAREKKAEGVIFLGKITEQDKICLFTLCHGVVLPSHLRSEAYGMCLVEGLMFGKPLISTEIGTGTSFVNQHEKTGYVVPPQNPEALKIAILNLLNKPEITEYFACNALQRFQSFFSAEIMCAQYLAAYSKL